MVDPAGAESPAALEVEMPALRPDLRDAPALRPDYRSQQLEAVSAMALGHELVDVQHVVRHVDRVDPRTAPDLGVRVEVVHRDLLGHRADKAVAHVADDLVGGAVAGAGDHRV